MKASFGTRPRGLGGAALLLLGAAAAQAGTTQLVGVDASLTRAAVPDSPLLGASYLQADGSFGGTPLGSVDAPWLGLQAGRSVTVSNRAVAPLGWAVSVVRVDVPPAGDIGSAAVHDIQMHLELGKTDFNGILVRSRAEANLVFRFDAPGAQAAHDIHFAYDWTLNVPPLQGLFVVSPQATTAGASSPEAANGWVWTAPSLPSTTIVPLPFGSRQGAGTGSFSMLTGGDYRFVIPLELLAFDLATQTLSADLSLRLAFADEPLAAIGAVPEPASWMLWLAGSVAVTACASRRRRAFLTS